MEEGKCNRDRLERLAEKEERRDIREGGGRVSGGRKR